MKVLTEILKRKYNLNSVEEISKVVMDSRKIEKNSLFIAINSGNNYIEEALAKEASLIIADNYSGDNEKVIVVEDSVLAIQELALQYRNELGVKVIGITGSNGKTTTKDIIYSILSQRYRCKKTEGNYNNHIGLPFTVLQLEDSDEIIVLEMGMSSFGEIDTLCKISQPDYGIITNIGDSHLEFLKTRENVFKAKSEIVKYVDSDKLLVCGDDFYLKSLNSLTVGYGANCKYQITDFVDSDNGIEFTLDSNHYNVRLNGEHNCLNSAMGIIMGERFNLSCDEIQRGLDSLNLTPMRFQKIEKGETIYINDAYNASPISMRYSLETFDRLYNDRVKIAVLGDMLELGEDEIKYHREVLEKANSIKVDKIYVYGSRMKKAYEILEDTKLITHFSDKEQIKSEIRKNFPQAKAILLKGSRGMKMEEIIEG
ncbi:UDP-N-acetylmuramoyl-tripeptide--D-alanyl-D-alanine ligase [Fusobacterium sp.]|uniref:UDP-N-acetylmuramoyl-tripeptide--D-alanyl-D- alanine ligase n=1 Tax=Fusobacterium sp. TaxID=68766 RepID=UPI00260B922A|nr:UDP-N-acetylmuramoyl-tripeptide--D-alanyl-D-alanine ligase [Fusobacterium sp.]